MSVWHEYQDNVIAEISFEESARNDIDDLIWATGGALGRDGITGLALIRRAVELVLARDGMRERLAAVGMSEEQFAREVQHEAYQWRDVGRFEE